MHLGEVIRTYRKKKGLTQEQMAQRLGVTAPAVNKWENANTTPDVALLAPIARLLGITTDTLLGFEQTLGTDKLEQLVREADALFDAQPYAQAFEWVKKQVACYPNCEELALHMACILDAQLLLQEETDKDKYEEYIEKLYELALRSTQEETRMRAGDALSSFYLRREEFDKAREAIAHLSAHDPQRKLRQALISMQEKDEQKACEQCERIVFDSFAAIDGALQMLRIMCMQKGDLQKAEYYAKKSASLCRTLEMGAYREHAAMLECVQARKDRDETLSCVRALLANVDTLFDFTSVPLYAHMTFRHEPSGFTRKLLSELSQGFFEDASFSYMKGDARWEALQRQYAQQTDELE